MHKVKLLTNFIYIDSLQPANNINCLDSIEETINVSGITTPPCKATFKLFSLDSLNPKPLTWYIWDYSYGIPPLTYLWDFGDGSTSTLQYPSHTYATQGHYDVCLTITDASACTSTTCDTSSIKKLMANGSMMQLHVVPIPTNGIGMNNNGITSVTAQPNPFNDQVILNLATNYPQKINVQITDVMGKLIYSENKNLVVGSNETKINTINFSEGLYFVKILSENNSFNTTVRIIK